MVTLGKVHVGDVGTEFQLEVKDTDLNDSNSTVDLAGVSAMVMIFTDPDGNETEVTASIANSPGSDGIISYINTDSNFIDIPGFWYYRAKLTFDISGNIFISNNEGFEVLGGVE